MIRAGVGARAGAGWGGSQWDRSVLSLYVTRLKWRSKARRKPVQMPRIPAAPRTRTQTRCRASKQRRSSDSVPATPALHSECVYKGGRGREWGRPVPGGLQTRRTSDEGHVAGWAQRGQVDRGCRALLGIPCPVVCFLGIVPRLEHVARAPCA